MLRRQLLAASALVLVAGLTTGQPRGADPHRGPLCAHGRALHRSTAPRSRGRAPCRADQRQGRRARPADRSRGLRHPARTAGDGDVRPGGRLAGSSPASASPTPTFVMAAAPDLPGGRHPVRHLRRHPSAAADLGRRLHVHDPPSANERPVLRHRRLRLRQRWGSAGSMSGRTTRWTLPERITAFFRRALRRAWWRDHRRGLLHDGRHRLLAQIARLAAVDPAPDAVFVSAIPSEAGLSSARSGRPASPCRSSRATASTHRARANRPGPELANDVSSRPTPTSPTTAGGAGIHRRLYRAFRPPAGELLRPARL